MKKVIPLLMLLAMTAADATIPDPKPPHGTRPAASVKRVNSEELEVEPGSSVTYTRTQFKVALAASCSMLACSAYPHLFAAVRQKFVPEGHLDMGPHIAAALVYNRMNLLAGHPFDENTFYVVLTLLNAVLSADDALREALEKSMRAKLAQDSAKTPGLLLFWSPLLSALVNGRHAAALHLLLPQADRCARDVAAIAQTLVDEAEQPVKNIENQVLALNQTRVELEQHRVAEQSALKHKWDERRASVAGSVSAIWDSLDSLRYTDGYCESEDLADQIHSLMTQYHETGERNGIELQKSETSTVNAEFDERMADISKQQNDLEQQRAAAKAQFEIDIQDAATHCLANMKETVVPVFSLEAFYGAMASQQPSEPAPRVSSPDSSRKKGRKK
ncbi:MAG: hypothetical protein LBB25_04545 [Holosporaceae bacterium]|jgi:hypothetical protein|nr:hypothetical protein [Holosporaceae bacterium]